MWCGRVVYCELSSPLFRVVAPSRAVGGFRPVILTPSGLGKTEGGGVNASLMITLMMIWVVRDALGTRKGVCFCRTRKKDERFKLRSNFKKKLISLT